MKKKVSLSRNKIPGLIVRQKTFYYIIEQITKVKSFSAKASCRCHKTFSLFTNGYRVFEGAGEGWSDKLKSLTSESYFLACLIFASKARCSTLM